MSSATKGSRRARTYPIRRSEQLEALASPVRQELVDALQASGPCSIAELAGQLGRASDSLYYHVRHLEQVGLIVHRGTRRAGRRDEALFDVPGARMQLDLQPERPSEISAVLDIVGAALRIAHRDLRAAFEAGLAVYRGRRRNAWGGRMKGWLTRAEVEQVRHHTDAIHELLQGGERREGGELYAFTSVFTPVAPSARVGSRRNST
jgi:DNA-binding transcriptional ArsR family regulator